MGIIHRSYLFHRANVQNMLSEIMLGGPLQILTRLLEAAQVAVREPGKYSKELLEDLTFDSTWLQEQKAEFNNTGRLLMAVVSNAVCGISFLEPECFAILERSLPQIGWQAGDTELLLR